MYLGCVAVDCPYERTNYIFLKSPGCSHKVNERLEQKNKCFSKFNYLIHSKK